MLAVPPGAQELDVEVEVRYDLAPDGALGTSPAADTSTFTLCLGRSTEPMTTETSAPTVRPTGARVPRVQKLKD
ncbi:hypothetical protein ACFQ1S_00050 [Kibdelosporangium lantanae]|uniref:Uncharacterized protein n=1 Tax=Kibdelosporangium lantanae TaxID=1497396 RepID=A0ABW3M3D2_9PSEU